MKDKGKELIVVFILIFLLNCIGTYVFLIDGKENIHIEGANISKTKGSSSIKVISSNKISFNNIKINANSKNDFSGNTSGDSFSIDNSDRIYLNNIEVINSRGKGLRFTKCYNSIIEKSYFNNCERSGISIFGGSENITIRDNILSNCMRQNIYGDGIIDIYGGSSDGLLANKNISIINNTLIEFGEKSNSEWNPPTGIRVNATYGALIDNNKILPNGKIGAAIRIEDRDGITSTNINVSNNYFETNFETKISAIRISAINGHDFLITGNNIKSNFNNSVGSILIKRNNISNIRIVGNSSIWNGTSYHVIFTNDNNQNNIIVNSNNFKGGEGDIYLNHSNNVQIGNNTFES